MNISLSNAVLWDAVGGASEYEYELLPESLASVLKTATIPGNSVSAVDLFSGLGTGNYVFRVRAKGGGLVSNYSALLSLTFTGIDPPSNLRVE